MIRRHVWKKMEISGDRSKAESSVLFSIILYTPIITIGLAGKYD